MGEVGDVRIDEYRFTVRDAEFLSGVAQKNIRNWIERGVLSIGQRHFTGRWTLNLLDVLQIRVMDDLAVRMALPSANMGESVKYAADTMKSWRNGKLTGTNANVVFAVHDNGEWMVGRFAIDNHGYRVPMRGDVNQALRRSHVVVPVTAMFEDILLKHDELERAT